MIWKHRGHLGRTVSKIAEGRLTVGFIGGSITDGRGGHNWPEPVMSWLIETFPTCQLFVENAAIGATGSALAVFRAERDLIERNCDLVFVEYAVNDFHAGTEQRMNSREGLIRKLLAGQGRDVVLVYTFFQGMYEDMAQAVVPDSIAEFEQIAAHYEIGSVWMGKYSFEEVKKGRMRWEEWLPDTIHPTERGSLSYGQSVIRFLEKELCGQPGTTEMLAGPRLPEPLHAGNWAQAYRFDLAAVKTEGPWSWKRSTQLVWMDYVLTTAAVGAKLSFSFHGRGLALGFDFGTASADFKYSIDHAPWVTHHMARPEWAPKSGWFKLEVIADRLELADHEIRIEVIHGNKPECKGTNFELALAGIIL